MSEDRSSNGQGSKSWLERFAQAFSDEPKDRDDLVELFQNAARNQVIDSEALDIIEGALHVSDIQVREIMVPRPQMVVINSELSPKDFLPEMIASAHSRFPVLGESPDEVIGILLAKDLLPFALSGGLENLNIHEFIRKPTFVPESKRLNILLSEFKANRNHMAIVVDEYGGIAGLVTIEDVLEQIVGDIEDEHDDDENDKPIKKYEDSSYIVKALTPITEFNEYFSSNFSDADFDTIGGIVTKQFERLPQREECIDIGDFNFKVLNADNRRIRLLQVTPLDNEVTE